MAQEKIPTIVIQINGGVINCVNSDIPVRVLILDADTEGGDEDRIMEVNGDEAYVHDYVLMKSAKNSDGFIGHGIEAEFVAAMAGQVDAADRER